VRDVTFASGCAVLVRLDALNGEPLFDESLFAFGEDLDLSLRMTNRGARIRYVPTAIGWHHEGASHRHASHGRASDDRHSDALRFYFSTRNTLRVLGRHARWYHWPVLGPAVVVDLLARYCTATLRRGDWRACGAVLHGALHAVTGGRHVMERDAMTESVFLAPRDATSTKSASY
jgi:hypothetical protein